MAGHGLGGVGFGKHGMVGKSLNFPHWALVGLSTLVMSER